MNNSKSSINVLELEKRIRHINNTHLTIGILSIIGLLSFVSHPISLFFTLGLPYLLSGILDRIQINKKWLLFHVFFRKTYEKLIFNWLNDYLDNSNNNLEKEYKLIFIKLYGEHTAIDFFNVPKFKEVINSNYAKIIESTDDEKNNYMYAEHMYSHSLKNFENIKNDLEKISVIKKVWNDFEHIGIFGRLIGNYIFDEFKFLGFLQNYKTTQSDRIILKEMISLIKKWDMSDFNSLMQLESLANNLDKTSILFENENDKLNLLLYKDLFSSLFYKKEHKNAKESIHSMINKKISYIDLSEELEEKLHNNVSLSKKKPNKI